MSSLRDLKNTYYLFLQSAHPFGVEKQDAVRIFTIYYLLSTDHCLLLTLYALIIPLRIAYLTNSERECRFNFRIMFSR